MSTGIFFHYQEGDRLKDFPGVLADILHSPGVLFYDAYYPSKPASSFDIEPVPIETIYRVHSPEMVKRIEATGQYMGCLYSAAGTLGAAIKIWTGEIINAFVFTGYGDHHAGSDFFGGGCYLNGAAIAIRELRERFGVRRVTVIDTDAHHGDGSWELFAKDPHVLYICLCPGAPREENQNLNVHVPHPISDVDYIGLVKNCFPRIEKFQPQVLFWNWGYDGTIGEYGDMGLTPGLHLKVAAEIKTLADKLCSGRLVVILCGGSRRDLASYLIPGIIRTLVNP